MAGIGGICSYGQIFQSPYRYREGSAGVHVMGAGSGVSQSAQYAGAVLSIRRNSDKSEEEAYRSSQMHDLLHSLNQQNKNRKRYDTDEAESGEDQIRKILKEQYQNSDIRITHYRDKDDSLIKLSGIRSGKKDSVIKKPLKYNFREIATKILRAKTSQSAGQALICAKRKVRELKGRISMGEEDPKELELALTHAKRMELLARKKKHNLELEELAGVTVEREERKDKAEESREELKNAMISAEEEKISVKEDEIFDERKEIFDEYSEDISGLNELLKDFGEEELEELEKAMEILESAEMINPHMSREDLEELKTEHRNKEMKALIKADMDYLEGSAKLAAENTMENTYSFS
ncbi:MAG: hypothetical protein K5886_10865 [Lachnospiraceae bacterium]|nr:hypothetical protein [Lachnospiraceae bacterium]